MAITAGMVKELREMTGAGMMDCKKALTATEGDMDAAVEFLRKNGQAKADALLKLYNKVTKTLTIKDACGDSRVRGGSLIVVQLDLGDVKLQNLMLVEKCVHKYGESKHTMDLTLSGGDFSA